MRTLVATFRVHPFRAGAAMLALLLGAAAPVSSVRAAAAGAPAGEEVVELPELAIQGFRELPPPESWRYAEFAGFEVLSTGSESYTKKLIRDFQLFQRALEIMWPVQQTVSAPSALILCGPGGKFDQFRPAGTAGDAETDTASLFLQNRERRAIILDLQTRSLTLVDPTSGAGLAEFEVEIDRQLFREYVHFLMAQGESRPPAWLEEGLAQIVMGMEFTDTWVRFGRIDSSAYAAGASLSLESAGSSEEPEADTSAGGAVQVGERPFNVALAHFGLMPLDQMFAVTHDSPVARNTVGTNLWAKQSNAFVHLCLYGANKKYQPAFGQFLQRLGREPLSEQLFSECFGMSYKQMLIVLRGHIQHTTYAEAMWKAKPGEKLTAEPPELREATQAEIGRMKGDALQLAGKNEAALAEYRIAYLRGERDPRLLASLGVAELAAGETARARPLLEAAFKGGIDHPIAYVHLARLRLADAEVAPAAPNGKLDDAQTQHVLAPLIAVRKFRPPQTQTYELIARVWSRSANKPTRENLAVLEEGAQIFRRQPLLLYNAAVLNAQAGFRDRAAELAQIGLNNAANEAGKARFSALLAALQKSAPAPTPSPAAPTAP